MAFSKSFPRTLKGSTYPRWEEIFISEEEESAEEQKCRLENINLMKECVEDAKKIFEEKDLKRYQTDLIRMAIAIINASAITNP